MAGLRRPRSVWSTSLLDHTSASRGASTSGTARRTIPPAQGSPASDGNHSFHQPGDPDSDSDVNPQRTRFTSASIDAKIQTAMAGAGFVKEGTFQEALARMREQDEQMASLDLQQRAINTGECPPSGLFISKVINYEFHFCIICNISDLNLIILGPVGQIIFLWCLGNSSPEFSCVHSGA